MEEETVSPGSAEHRKGIGFRPGWGRGYTRRATNSIRPSIFPDLPGNDRADPPPPASDADGHEPCLPWAIAQPATAAARLRGRAHPAGPRPVGPVISRMSHVSPPSSPGRTAGARRRSGPASAGPDRHLGGHGLPPRLRCRRPCRGSSDPFRPLRCRWVIRLRLGGRAEKCGNPLDGRRGKGLRFSHGPGRVSARPAGGGCDVEGVAAARAAPLLHGGAAATPDTPMDEKCRSAGHALSVWGFRTIVSASHGSEVPRV
jgi:hypothetical protein